MATLTQQFSLVILSPIYSNNTYTNIVLRLPNKLLQVSIRKTTSLTGSGSSNNTNIKM